MEAKDTVMNDMLIKVWCLEFVQPGELDLNAKLKDFAADQAEISFKAGIKEVVDWAREKDKHNRFGFEDGTLLIYKEDWQAFKKSKGIAEGQ